MNTPTRPAKRAPAPARPSVSAGSNPFEELTNESASHGKFLMLYSEAGEGKTTLASQFPDPMFIVTAGEQGIYLYKQRGMVPASVPVVQLDPLYSHGEIPDGGHPGWLKCIKAMQVFRDSTHDRKTLVIDSTSGLQDLCFQHCASMLFEGDMDSKEFTDYYRGYTKAAEAYWSGVFLPLCLEIVAKGYNVILIAHSSLKPVHNPIGPDFEQFRPNLYKTIFEYTKKDLHGIFFLWREVAVSIDQKTKKKTTMGDRRFIGLSPSPYYVAKTWCTPEGMNEIDCGESPAETWSKLKEALGM